MLISVRRASWPILLLVASIVLLPATLALSEEKADSEIGEETARRAEAYAHLMRAVFAARQGDFREAAGEAKRAVELEPDSPQVHVQSASLLLWIGRVQDAERLARAALVVDPDYVEAIRFLADLQAGNALGARPDEASRLEAERLYERLIGLEQDDDDVLRNLTNLKLAGQDLEGAIVVTRRLVERTPGDRRAAGNLAQMLIESAREEQGLRVLMNFVVKHPSDGVMIDLAEKLARNLNAWALVEEVIRDQTDGAARGGALERLRGEALLNLNRIEEATEALENAMASEPSDRQVRYNLANAYRSSRRFADAAVLGSDLALEAPEDASAHLLLGEILQDQGDLEGAIVAFLAAQRTFADRDQPGSPRVRDAIRRQLVILYLESDQLDKASFELARFEDPQAGEVQDVRARLALKAENWEQAREAAAALRSAGIVGPAALYEGELLLRTGKRAKAEQKFRDGIESLGPYTRVSVAEICFDAGETTLALELLHEWVRSQPELADASYYLGTFLFRADRFDEAERAMRAAIALDEEHAAALNFLGYTLAEKSIRLDEALELVRRALAVDSFNGAFLDSLGWVYYQMGRYEQAREPLERAAREHPKDPTVLEHLGDLYSQLGQTELAVAAWRRALAGKPENAGSLQQKIARSRTQVGPDRDGASTPSNALKQDGPGDRLSPQRP